MDEPQPPERAPGWVSGPTLGAGAFGAVRLVTHSGRVGAMKSATDAAGVHRLHREQDALSRLDHPSIVQMLDHGRSPDEAWLVLELIPGHTLAHYRATPPLPFPAVLGITRALAEALAHAHAHGVAHGDLKPANVILRPDGRPVLLDFGGANLAGDATGPRAGTPAYAPPEWQEAAADPRHADVYALGVLTWELLMGRPAPSTRPLDLAPGDTAPNAAAWLVRAATSTDPGARPSAAELADRLAEWPLVPPPSDVTVTGHPAAPPPENVQRIGRYAIRGVLGRGGAGTVFRAYDPTLAREVALKRLHTVDGDSRVRFEREARTLATLDHPHIVRVLDFGADDDGALYYTMPRIDAPDLAEVLRRGPVPIADALRWTVAIGSALAAAHRAGVVHRDVKPGNVLLEGDQPRLVDFGLATAPDAATLTRTGQVMGTPAYMSPEQAAGRPVDARTDVYSLGAVLYELLSRAPPHAADHPAAVLHGVLHGAPRPLADAAPHAPALVARVCHRALSRDPADRYPTMDAFLRDLERAGRGESVDAGGAWRARARHLWSRHRAMGTAAVALAMAASVASAPPLWRRWQDHERATWADGRLAALTAEVEAHVSEGRVDEADDLVAAFVALPEAEGTHAQARARLEQAARLDARGATAAAMTTCAAAWADALSPHDRAEALLRLGRLAERTADWAALEGIVETLATAPLPDPNHRADADALRATAAAAAADLARAATFGGPLAPALRALSAATPAFAGYTDAAALDLDGDGHAELVGVEPAGGLAWAPSGAWHTAPRPLNGEDGRYTHIEAIDGDRYGPMLIGWTAPAPGDRGRTRVLRLHPTPRRVAQIEADNFTRATLTDLDGDGRPTLYLGVSTYDRDLLAFTPDAAGEQWTVSHPHPPTSDTNSDVQGAVAIRDAHGPALIVASTSFSAYDLRLLRPDPDDGHLRMDGRRRIGAIDAVTPLPGPTGDPRLLLTHRGPELPGGVHVFDAGLALVASAPTPGLICQRLYTGDWDGDGVTDVAGACLQGGLLGRQAADGSLRTTLVPGLYPMASGDGDGDGDDELVVRFDGRVWILGAGDAALPVVAHLPERRAAPPAADAHLSAEWRRAEDVLRMGQADLARQRFEAMAALDTGPAGAAALLRAAELAAHGRDPDAAMALYARAAERPGVAREASGRAADLATRLLRLDEAARWTQRWLTTPGGSAAERTRREEELARIRTFGATPPVDPGLDPRRGWQVLRPLEVRAAPGGLEIDAVSPGPLLRLPLRRVSDLVGLAGSLTLRHGEWDSSLRLHLRPVQQPTSGLLLDLRGHGSAEGVQAQAICASGAQVIGALEVPQASTEWTGDLVFSVQATDERRACALASAGPRASDAFDGAPLPTGDWELVVDSAGDRTFERTAVVLRGLTLTGFAVRDEPAGPDDRLRAALAAGGWSEALALGLGGSPERELLAAVALDELGDSNAAQARALAAATGDDLEALLPWLAPILRGRAPRLLPAVRAGLSDRFADAFHVVWRTPMQVHPRDPALHAALDGLDGAAPPADPADACELHRAQALALRVAGRAEAADRAADRAVAAGRVAGPRPLAAALRTKAASTADPEAAFAALAEALQVHPAPETLADALTVDPELQRLRTDPRWADLEAARRLTVAP